MAVHVAMRLFLFQTHVCIQQTCIDLLKAGKQVFVVADACSSRNQMDREFALQVCQLYHSSGISS